MDRRTPRSSRLLLTIAFAIAALLTGIIGAVAAGTGTVTPPPKIAFVTTNADVAPDALTVGPMAGRLGAPLFITDKNTLSDAARGALVDFGADLIIVVGGPNTVTGNVMEQIAAATGKTIKDIDDVPADGVVRVFGSGRDQTAAALAGLIAAYNPHFLPVGATATDADLLDGKDSTAFLGKTETAADSDKLDGMDSTDFAKSATSCTTGQVVTGVDAAGDLTCAVDDVDGGDAETLDGLDSTDLLAGTVRALAWVDPTFPDFLRGFGFSAVSRPYIGGYCLTLDPALGLDNGDVIAQVSPEWGESGGGDLFVSWNAEAPACTSDQIEVVTQQFVVDGEGDVSGVAGTNDVAFTVAVYEAGASPT